MKRKDYTFTNEPKGSEYLRLLTIGLEFCNKAVLITRDQFDISEKSIDLMRVLEPFEVETKKTAEWPGTILHGHEATAVTYSFNEECIAAIETITNSLFEWQTPDLPEDLHILRPDGSPWLASIAHEQYAWLELTEGEYVSLKSSYPEFASMLLIAD